jgi:hypothetical protein
MPHLAIGFFFLRRNKYEIAKVRYFPGEKLYKGILQFFPNYDDRYHTSRRLFFLTNIHQRLQGRSILKLKIRFGHFLPSRG